MANSWKIKGACAGAIVMAASATTAANILYGVDSATDRLYRISATTGEATSIGWIGFNSDSMGIAFSPVEVQSASGGVYPAGTLFGYDKGSGQLVTFDLTTGAATSIGVNTAGLTQAESLTFDLAGNLYTSNGSTVYSLSTTNGAATLAGTLGNVNLDGWDLLEVALELPARGISIPAGRLIGVDNGTLYAINPANFAIEGTFALGNTFADEDLAVAPDGTIYGAGTSLNGYDINLISPSLTSATLIGATGLNSLFALEAIPAPGAAGVVAMGLVAMLRRRR